MECKCPQAFEFRSSKSFQGVEGRYTCTYMVLRWWNSSNLNVLVLNHSYDDEGVFGINIHHAGIKDAAEYNLLLTKYTDMVEKYSAGCQVLEFSCFENHCTTSCMHLMYPTLVSKPHKKPNLLIAARS
jgi:hypothetical protein